MTVATLLDRLEHARATAPDRWLARCPAHDDRSPSLSIRVVDDRVLVHCFGGCEPDDIMAALGLSLSDLFEQPLSHHRPPSRSRIPARDVLAAIDHEAHVVAIIGADIHERHDIDAETWDRLATATRRIGAAREMTR